MPGKLPGGKVRISSTAPSILSKTKISPSSEVKYYGLIRDEALDDLTSRPDALEEVLEDIQDPAERKAEGEMNAADLSIIDGIVSYDIRFEDLEVLNGASLQDGNGKTLVNPRQRITDRISQFETFVGRGTPFIGAGPVKFIYMVPQDGDLLDGSVAIATNGTVTGTGTSFATDLAIGDFVILTKEDGVTKHRLNNSDQAVYKITGITSNNAITVEPKPSQAISGGKKFRKRYCHNSPPPFFTENITSTAFNAPDHIPSLDEISKSHRQGYILDGSFKPYIENEKWWEGAYNQDFRERAEYGGIGSTPDQNAKYPIVKDGNISFEFASKKFSQDSNFGIRYDAWLKWDFDNSRSFYKWIAQTNGHIRIDYFHKTSIDPSTGVAIGTWKTAIDTSNSDTFFTQISKEDPATNVDGYRTYRVQGGPDYASSSLVDATNSINVTSTYTDQEGTSRKFFDGDYVPVIIRYWFGQDTIDNSTSPIPSELLSVKQYIPSFALDIVPTNLPSNLLSKWNNYFGGVKLVYNDGVADASGYARWDIDGSTRPANYEATASEFNSKFEVVAYDASGKIPPFAASKNYLAWKNTIAEFMSVPTEVLIGEKIYDSGTSAFLNSQVSIDFPTVSSPSHGDIVFALIQNRPRSILPQTTKSETYNLSGSDEVFQKYLYNPNYLERYTGAADLLEGSTNFIEPNPIRVPFEESPEYFKYKYGKLPALNTYGVDRYDGTIYNRITSYSGERDYDYSHTKLLMIGRQKKDDSIKQLQPDEVRNAAENYTFITVEADKAGNGGEVLLLGKPINSMAVIAGGAGQENGGKALHGTDNTSTFSNSDRQNISTVALNYLPDQASYGSSSDKKAIAYREFLGEKILAYTPNRDTGAYDTTGIISSSSLGGATRNTANKTIYIPSFNRDKGTERFFYGLIPAERRIETALLTLGSGGVLESEVLFSNDDGAITNNNQPYLGATIELYPASDAELSETPVVKTVNSYDATNQRVTLNNIVNLSVGTSYICRVYYNYFRLTKDIPSKVLASNGVVNSTGFPAIDTSNALQIRFIFNTTYEFLRADSGSGLNFAETLFVTPASSPTQADPFGDGTELPSPPSALVSPLGYDKGPTDPTNPGLGGICYPPHSGDVQDINLKETGVSDATLAASAEGHFDVYFGSPQISLTNLGNKHLEITDQILFDFDPDDRALLIVEGGSYPAFDASSYTHKLRVELNPFIGKPGPTPTGLFARPPYTSVTNDNIFKDALKYSNNKPVKETFFMFTKKATGTGETSISLLAANNPGWT